MSYRKKLIEVALPLEAINRESAREKSIRHGHPSTLHLWWARRPLAACRAVLFTSLVDDPDEPGAPQEYLDEIDKLRGGAGLPPETPIAEVRREKLFRFIEELVKWDNSNNERIIGTARRLIKAATEGNPPPVLDPFCGGGSIPLEAQRLGLEAHASDLNPVAVLITKALIEIPPKFAGQPPVNPDARGSLVVQASGLPPEAHGVVEFRPGHDLPFAPLQYRGELPHLHKDGGTYFVTFRLADAVVVRSPRMAAETAAPQGTAAPQEVAESSEPTLQQGSCLLGDPIAARVVADALMHFDRDRYALRAWCVMPNHVHVVFTPVGEWKPSQILHSWKSYTAHEINKALGRTGPVWERESFDHLVRSFDDLQRFVAYVERNPVEAGLASEPTQWPFSSAGHQPCGAGVSPAGVADASPAEVAGVSPVEVAGVSLAEVAGVSPAEVAGKAERSRPEACTTSDLWPGATGLADDVRYYGKWMRDEAEKRIGHLYPKAKLPKEQGGGEATVIAWLWARTVMCPNPACNAQMPLVRSFWLSTKKGKEAWVEPIVDQKAKTVRFEVRTGGGRVPEGTMRNRAATCLVCNGIVQLPYVRAEAQAGRMGTMPLAMVAEGQRQRVYLPPDPEHGKMARSAQPAWKPEEKVTTPSHDVDRLPMYGMYTWGEAFTPRQLVALTTFCDLVGEAREKVKQDYQDFEGSFVVQASSLQSEGVEEGEGRPEACTTRDADARAYADAVTTYLALAVSRITMTLCTNARWSPTRDQTVNAFARQAIPMIWDFPDVNPFAGAAGDPIVSLASVSEVLTTLHPGGPGHTAQLDAASSLASVCGHPGVCTDPPYYDNIGYADLSDFFYVWLRRSLGKVYPELFATLLVPKAQELVATPYRFDGSGEKAQAFFEEGLGRAFANMRAAQHPDYPLTVFYAFKQAEQDEDDGNGGTPVASTGWETMLEALLSAGFAITGTWPMRSERTARSVAIGTNALASSIVLVCRPRPGDAPMATRREFTSALRKELPPALEQLTHAGIAPVDLAQATIGPGMAVFSRYSKVLEADGSPMGVRTALQIINQELDTYLAEQEGDLDADTRFCIAWFGQYGLTDAAFGEADVLARAKNTSVEGIVDAGVLHARGGKVRLRQRCDYPEDWDPTTDRRLTVWECAQHLIGEMERSGEEGAAALVRRLGGGISEDARALAYRLYAIADRKGWSDEARAYNGLVVSWPAIVEKAARAPVGQRDLFG